MTIKMTVLSFSDPKFELPFLDVPPFVAHVNPENYTQATQIKFAEDQAVGSSGQDSNYSHTEPVKMQFDFLLDRTGALGNVSNEINGVEVDIAHFKKLAFSLEGEIHKPRYLKLCWGALIFKCQLEALEVEYKLFNRQGMPLRAVLKCGFREFKEKEQNVLEDNRQSPDISHVRTVEAGDTLPLMCFKIYGDSKYYAEVARANDLTDFRRLHQGQQLLFPPLEKTAS